ncbi:hypothetical protein K4E_19610 [Enterococcus thailandicus]|nr:hypothetical protein K4E_19610 [Enterococcus thailandicus]
MLIEDKLAEQETFTTTEKRIADYIRLHFEEAVYLTIEELAKATYTSPSTFYLFLIHTLTLRTILILSTDV